MANTWTTPSTLTDGSIVGATIWHQQVRDNMEFSFDRYMGGQAWGFAWGSDFLGVPADGVCAANVAGGTVTGGNALLGTASQRPGQLKLDTGAVATNRAGFMTSFLNQIVPGSGTILFDCTFQLSALSTVTDRYQALFGLFDTATAANQANGFYFLYDEGGVSTGSTASANWQVVTVASSIRTFTTSATAVTAATWIRLTVTRVSSTSVAFAINGTVVATHTTNLTTAGVGFGANLIKSIGTTARFVTLDTMRCYYQLTTAR